jgi:hypothetical protein
MKKICKQLIALCLLCGIFANCSSYWIVSSAYALNKSYIASVLCTNKDKPHLHCEGKCFLDIKLKELEQKNKHEQEQLKRVIETTPPFQASLLPPVHETVVRLNYSTFLQQKTVGSTSAIFQPPKQA